MNSLSRWELAGYLSTAAVVAGCAGESIHELTGWFKGVNAWKVHGGKISAWVLIAALAVEVPIQLKTNQISGQVISRINLKTAELNKRTAESELEVARVRDAQTPRLMRFLRSDFRKLLKGRPAGSARIWYVAENEDALAFSMYLGGFMKGAGWNVTDPVVIPLQRRENSNFTLFMTATGGFTDPNGIVIRCSKDSVWEDESGPVGVLWNAFSHIGLSVGINSEPFPSMEDDIGRSIKKNEALIIIGNVPM